MTQSYDKETCTLKPEPQATRTESLRFSAAVLAFGAGLVIVGLAATWIASGIARAIGALFGIGS